MSPWLDDVDALITSIRSRDALEYEGAHLVLAPRAREVVPRLLEELQRSSDAYTRGKFVELLGESRDPSTVPDLIRELSHSDQNVRQWAVTALRMVATKEALDAADAYEAAHPAEFA